MDDPSDAVAFRALFEAELGYVWSVLRRLGVPESDAEDLTHEVFLQVFRKLSEYDVTRPVRPWLFGFAYRIASDERRRARHRREVIGADPSAVDTGASAEERLVASDDHSLLHEALDHLPIERRAILVLHEWDEAPMPDVASALGIPLNTAYSRLRVAREELASSVRRIAQRKGKR